MVLLHRISGVVNRWIEILLGSMGIGMAFIVALQVFCRYVLNHSLFWSEELARILLIWLTFLGATAAYQRKVHPTIDIISLRVNERLQIYLKIAVYLVSILFFIIMIIHGFQFAYFARLQISPALHLPKWLIYAAVPVSGMLFLLHSLSQLSQEFFGDCQDDN